MAGIPKEHSTLYFDALCRTQKKETLYSLIKATYYAKKRSLSSDETKIEIAKRLQNAYGLYKDNIRGYDNGYGSYQGTMDQFQSQYTIGHEMSIWKNSDLDLNELALQVARDEITITRYLDIVLLNYFQPIDGTSVNLLYSILIYLKNNRKRILTKEELSTAIGVPTEDGSTNGLFNLLGDTSYFTFTNNQLVLNESIDIDALKEKCNIRYIGTQGYERAKVELDTNEKYTNYIIGFQEETTETENNDAEDISEANLEIQRLKTGQNVLLYGVPGSGKSWTIEHEYCKSNTRVERLVFHPDYTYSDFIGQILPSVAENGQVSYKFTPGPFTTILRDAYLNPDKEYILIIEEINRGNAPAIFGEVFQLLDRTTEVNGEYPIGTSEYGITNENIAKIVYDNARHKIRIPSNLSIIGTMNTSDQNVFTLDTAFQRRWEMRLIENNFEHVDKKLANAQILDTGVTWKTFCTEINDIIVGNNARMTSSEDKRLGAYFVHLQDLVFDDKMNQVEYDSLREKEEKNELNEQDKIRIAEIRNAMKQNRRFPEKVIKYLWDDAFKFNREIVFNTTEYQSLEQVIRQFMRSSGVERFDMFKDNVKNAFIHPEE